MSEMTRGTDCPSLLQGFVMGEMTSVADCFATFSQFVMSEMTRVTDCMGEAITISHGLPAVLQG